MSLDSINLCPHNTGPEQARQLAKTRETVFLTINYVVSVHLKSG